MGRQPAHSNDHTDRTERTQTWMYRVGENNRDDNRKKNYSRGNGEKLDALGENLCDILEDWHGSFLSYRMDVTRRLGFTRKRLGFLFSLSV